jgi:biotin synthase
MSVCSGGILGLGEKTEDRLKMLEILSNFNPQPESVPINSLVPIPGTPLAEEQGVDSFEVVRMIAIARIAIPTAKVRLSAGRKQMSEELQTLCFFAGANSIFYGDKLLTTGNPQSEADLKLLEKLGLSPQKPNRDLSAPDAEESRPLEPALS